MKNYLLGILVIFVSACGNSTTSLDQNQTDILPIVFSKQLTGKIGENLSITMSLERNDSILNGKYYYHGQEGFLMLSGRYFGKNEIELNETNSKGNVTGLFLGSFVSESRIEGVWVNPKSKKETAFFLDEVKTGVAKISKQRFFEEKCPKKEDVDPEDYRSPCSYVDYSYIEIETDNKNIDQRINQQIKDFLFGDVTKDSLVRLVKSSEFQEVQDEGNVEVLYNANNLLSISVWHSSGLYPATGDSYTYNFSLESGEEVKLADLFIGDFRKKLNDIGRVKFIKEYGSLDEYDFEGGIFKLNDHFAILPSGIEFIFSRYEISAGAMGDQKVFISYKEVEDYINPNGLIPKVMVK